MNTRKKPQNTHLKMLHTKKMKESKSEEIALAIVSVHSPILCGLYRYEDSKLSLFHSIETHEKVFEALPKIFEQFISAVSQNLTYKNMKISRIFYANGPGSFTSIKLTHIFLQTLQHLYSFELLSNSSFYFSHSPYIKAFGQTYFYQNENGEILITSKTQEQIKQETAQNHRLNWGFFLPAVINENLFSPHTKPLYILPPI